MRQTFTLLLLLALLSSSVAFAQKAVLMQTYENIGIYNAYLFSKNSLFVYNNNIFYSYNLQSGEEKGFSSSGSPYLSPNKNMVAAGGGFIYSNKQGGMYLATPDTTYGLSGEHDIHRAAPGKGFTLIACLNITRDENEIIAVNTTTRELTKLLSDNIGSTAVPMHYAEHTGMMYFSVSTTDNFTEVYATDGTEENTHRIYQTNGNSSQVQFIDNGQEVYFIRYESQDGTSYGYKSGYVYQISSSDNEVIAIGKYQDLWEYAKPYVKANAFYGYNTKNNTVFAASEGNTTNLLTDVFFTNFKGEYNSKALFTTVTDVLYPSDTVVSLYQTDGTAAGTKLISDKVLEAYSFALGQTVINHNGNLYFFRMDEAFGGELWKYDGNELTMLEKVFPGPEGLQSVHFYVHENELYFTARPNSDHTKLLLYKVIDKASHITLSSYIDYNSNNIHDADEPYLADAKYKIDEGASTVFTRSNSTSIWLSKGTHTITPVAKEGWLHTSANPQVRVNIPEDNDKSYSFGLRPEQVSTKVDASLMSDATRCGFPTPYTLHYSNSGSTVASGTIKLIPEKKFTFDSATPAPHAISGDTLIWQFNDLGLGKKGKIILNFTMPGVEHMGDTLVSRLYTYFRNAALNTAQADTATLQQILTCSYDPNDIQVNPAGEGEKHLTLKKKKLDYRIRFQNMGTDKAFNIVVKNELQQELDLSTFEVIASSHDMYTLMDGNKLSFHFNNIHLPDDKTDEPGSHGYILYSIKPKAGLPDSTVIQNQAFIYFDYNPAIKTNITFNTLVDRLPAKAVLAIEDTAGELAPTMFPNPADDKLNITWPVGGSPYTLYSLINSQGQLVKQVEFSNGNRHQIDVANLPAGLYFLRATRRIGTFVRKVLIK